MVKAKKLILHFIFFFTASDSVTNAAKKTHQSQLNKSSSKKKVWDKRRDGKQSFNHEWLLTSLKGHTSDILDMELSPNGKYLATCGEGKPNFLLLFNFEGVRTVNYVNIH